MLTPGDHPYYTRAYFNLTALILNLPEILVDQIDNLKNGRMVVNVTGIGNMKNGMPLPYFAYALSHLDAEVQVPFVDLLNNTIQPILQEGIELGTGFQQVLQGIQTGDLTQLFAGGGLNNFFQALGNFTSGRFLQ